MRKYWKSIEPIDMQPSWHWVIKDSIIAPNIIALPELGGEHFFQRIVIFHFPKPSIDFHSISNTT